MATNKNLHSGFPGQRMDGKTKVPRKKPAIGERANAIIWRSDEEHISAAPTPPFERIGVSS
jgi:hypothetical protein